MVHELTKACIPVVCLVEAGPLKKEDHTNETMGVLCKWHGLIRELLVVLWQVAKDFSWSFQHGLLVVGVHDWHIAGATLSFHRL